MTLIVLGAIAASFFVGRYEADRADERALAANLASCMRENSRSAIGSAWQHELADFANNAAEREQVIPLEQLVRGSEAYLSIANYIEDPTAAVQTRTVLLDNGTVARVLTERSSALIQEGCERSYGASPGTAVPLPLPVAETISPAGAQTRDAP